MSTPNAAEEAVLAAIYDARLRAYVQASADGAGAPEGDRRTEPTRDACVADLDDFVFQYCFAFESTHGGPERRTDELLEARKSLVQLVDRRGWFVGDDSVVAAHLNDALAMLTEEHEQRRRRWNEGRKSKSTLQRLYSQLPSPDGREAPWREDFALGVGDAIRAWDRDGRRRDVNLPALLAKIEGVVWARHPEVTERTGISQDAIYASGNAARNRRATDRWRKTVKRVELAIAQARHLR